MIYKEENRCACLVWGRVRPFKKSDAKAEGGEGNSESLGMDGSPALPLEGGGAVWQLANVSELGEALPVVVHGCLLTLPLVPVFPVLSFSFCRPRLSCSEVCYLWHMKEARWSDPASSQFSRLYTKGLKGMTPSSEMEQF